MPGAAQVMLPGPRVTTVASLSGCLWQGGTVVCWLRSIRADFQIYKVGRGILLRLQYVLLQSSSHRCRVSALCWFWVWRHGLLAPERIMIMLISRALC